MAEQYQKKTKSPWIQLVPVAVFLAVLLLFFQGINSLSSVSEEKEMETIEDAAIQSALFCYGTEGAYPESIDYLESNYGFTYNEEKYIVEYQVVARNLRPQIRVLRRNKRGQ